jgi:hypothetical protein
MSAYSLRITVIISFVDFLIFTVSKFLYNLLISKFPIFKICHCCAFENVLKQYTMVLYIGIEDLVVNNRSLSKRSHYFSILSR